MGHHATCLWHDGPVLVWHDGPVLVWHDGPVLGITINCHTADVRVAILIGLDISHNLSCLISWPDKHIYQVW